MRVWKAGDRERTHAARGAFTGEAAAFQAEPYRDADKFRSSFHYYETFRHPEVLTEMPIVDRVIDTETLVMHGVEDEMMSPFQIQRAEVGFRNLVGPFCVDRGGHFLSWERPRVVNSAIVAFCRDLL
jgi:pimeloyl-ACP methyl ester carboxylesterase